MGIVEHVAASRAEARSIAESLVARAIDEGVVWCAAPHEAPAYDDSTYDVPAYDDSAYDDSAYDDSSYADSIHTDSAYDGSPHVGGARGGLTGVVLVVSSSARVSRVKLELARAGTLGIGVCTCGQLIEECWGLTGDGRHIVSAAQRRLLLRGCLDGAGLIDARASTKLLDMAASFVSEATVRIGEDGTFGEGDTPGELVDSERRIMDMTGLYARLLESHGLIEAARAAREFETAPIERRLVVVLDEPDVRCSHERRFLEMLSENMPVHVVHREPPMGAARDEGAAQNASAAQDEGAAQDEAAAQNAGATQNVAAAQDEAAAQNVAAPPDSPYPYAAPVSSRPAELDALRGRLYTGRGGLEATGAVLVGEAYGAHVTGELLAEMIERLHGGGVAYGEIAVAGIWGAGEMPQVLDVLARRRIPFEGTFRVRLEETGLGSALCDLALLDRMPDDPDSTDDGRAHDALASLVLSPYSGIDPGDARALDARWRGMANSTAAARMTDVREGFASGVANAHTVRERLEPLVALLDADDAERVAMLFENGKSAGLSVDALLDDRAAAETALDFLECATELGVSWETDDLGGLSVTLERSSAANPAEGAAATAAAAAAEGAAANPNAAAAPDAGPGAGAVRFVSPSEAVDCGASWVVLGNLSAERFPMAAAPDVFDGLLAKLSLAAPDDTARRQRVMLADVVESCTGGFAFWRCRHDVTGDESRQSALYDELLGVYRTSADDEDSLADCDVPAALAAYRVTVSEAGEFHRRASSPEPGLSSNLGSPPSPGAPPNLGSSPSPGAPPNLWQKSHFVRQASLRSPDEQSEISATRVGSQSEISATGFEEPRGAAVAEFPVARGVLRDGASIDALAMRGGEAREFSPTQLEDYHRCPYLWFTTRRVGARSLDRSFDASALGTLFHDTMARFYPMLAGAGHERVTPENLDEALDIASRAFDEQVKASLVQPKKGLLPRTRADRMEIESVGSRVAAFVERDAQFLPGFVPTYFEVGLARSGTPLEYATVPTRGAVDRIDVDSRGNAVVIDYKLGSLRSGYGLPAKCADGEISQHVQADIYARLVEKHFAMQGVKLHVVASVYRSYSVNLLRGVYSADVDFGTAEELKARNDALPRKDLDMTYGDYLVHVEDVIGGEVARLAAGDIAPAPIDDGACTYCVAREFCPKAAKKFTGRRR